MPLYIPRKESDTMKARKMFIVFLVTALMVVASPSVFAKHGFADTIADADLLWRPGTSAASATQPIESFNDNDFYLVDNTHGDYLSYAVILKSPPGLNYDLQLIIQDGRGQILQVKNVYDTGTGGTDGLSSHLEAGYKMYIRVQSHGYNDYSSSQYYNLIFEKHN